MIPSKESLLHKLLYDLMHIFCYSDLSGNKIAELPGSVFSKLAKLTNLWVCVYAPKYISFFFI